MKVGLFFGSFNPIHMGHLIIANSVVETTDLHQVWFIVSPQNPFKKKNVLLHEFDRYDMVEKAIEDNPKFKAKDIEFHLPRPSYTIDTLTLLQEKNPEHEFVLIMGSDNLAGFEKWKNYDKILEYFSLYVYPRLNTKESSLMHHSKVKHVDAPILNISATYIRNCISKHLSIRYLVPDNVESFIKEKKFYL